MSIQWRSLSRNRTAVLILTGAVAVFVLQMQFMLAWRAYYSHFPFRGYGSAMEQGLVPPFLTTSARGVQVTQIAFFALPLLALWRLRGNVFTGAAALWAGVMFAVVVVWVATPQLRQDSNMWPIDLVLGSVMFGLPIAIGAFTYWVIQRLSRLMRKSA